MPACSFQLNSSTPLKRKNSLLLLLNSLNPALPYHPFHDQSHSHYTNYKEPSPIPPSTHSSTHRSTLLYSTLLHSPLLLPSELYKQSSILNPHSPQLITPTPYLKSLHQSLASDPLSLSPSLCFILYNILHSPSLLILPTRPPSVLEKC